MAHRGNSASPADSVRLASLLLLASALLPSWSPFPEAAAFGLKLAPDSSVLSLLAAQSR